VSGFLFVLNSGLLTIFLIGTQDVFVVLQLDSVC